MHIVEIPCPGDALAETMAIMRDWLDAHEITPALFTMSVASNSVVLRLQFSTASEATKFADPFGGQVVSPTAARAA